VRPFASGWEIERLVSDVVDDLYTVDGERFVLSVHVQPRAGRSAVLGRHGRALRLRVAAPPVGDRANEAAHALLADAFEVKPAQVELVAGQRSRLKQFRIGGISREDLESRLRRAIRAADPAGGPSSRLRGG
jgi:uncharacterized protein (TIGR00251 family)